MSTDVAGDDLGQELSEFRRSAARFFAESVVPHRDRWERAGCVDRSLYLEAGAAGLLGMAVPEEYGGGGVADFRFNAVLSEEAARADAISCGLGLLLHNDVCVPYLERLGSQEQRQRWLPGVVTGELVTAIAMTEPGTGSDLAAIRTTATEDGDDLVVNGAKTFISNGFNAELIIVACRIGAEAGHRGLSLVVVEADRPGFNRGRNLEKIGLHAQDTAELFFDDVRVPRANLLGEAGAGFTQLVGNLPQERLSIAVMAIAHARRQFELTLEYVRSRSAFGQPIGSFQNSRFQLADIWTELDVGQTYVDRAVALLNSGALSAERAAAVKLWCTQTQNAVLDRCLQLHGGYGYMEEYPIARAWRDGRITTIFGGTNEIMREIIGRSINL